MMNRQTQREKKRSYVTPELRIEQTELQMSILQSSMLGSRSGYGNPIDNEWDD